MCELDYRLDSSKTEAIFNGFIIVSAILIAIVHQSEKGHSLERKIYMICKFYEG